VHAVGGTMGALLTGFLATDKVNGNLSYIADAASANPATKNGLAKLVSSHMLWVEQLKAIGLTLVLAVVGTVIIAYIVKAITGLRVSEDTETMGLDLAEHGEEGYHGVS
jgi:Amt family ammonium transporter